MSEVNNTGSEIRASAVSSYWASRSPSCENMTLSHQRAGGGWSCEILHVVANVG